MAVRITRSASDSSRSISSQVLSAASAVSASADAWAAAHGVAHALAALDAQVGQAGDLLGHVAHVVQGHGLGRVLEQVGDVVHGVDQAVDLLAVDRGDEGLVQQPVDLVRDAVRSALGVVHFLVVLVARHGVGVIGHQPGKCVRSFDDPVRVLVEHLEKIALTGQQLGKQHGSTSNVSKR
jgi:hypothetical protein